MSSANRSLGLAALGWWLAARGLSEPIDESFFRLEAAGVQRLGKSSRLAALVTVRRLANALRDEPEAAGAQSDFFSPGAPWLERLETVLNTPRVGLRLEKALVGDAEDFAALLEVELAEERSLMLAARLAEWLRGQVEGGDAPEALATFLAQGWPLARGSERRVTLLQEFLANLHAELSDAPREITLPLGEPGEFLEWLAAEAGRVSPGSEAERKPLDLPPPAPAAPPAPRIDAPEEFYGGGMPGAPEPDEPAAEENPATIAPSAEEEPPTATVAPAAAAVAPSPATVPDAVYEHADRERGRLRRWAMLFQLAWVVLLVVGWRAFQRSRSHLPTTPAATPAVSSPATPRATGSHAAVPPSPRLTVGSAPAATPPPRPLPPELAVAPGDLQAQALSLAAAGNHAEAVGLYRRIVQLQAQNRSLGRLPRALVYARMAASLAALERWDEADASIERAQALLEELLPTHDAETALGVEMVADYWASRERWPLAARLYQKAVQTYEDTVAENSLQQISVMTRLAGALRQIGEMKQAEQLLRYAVKAYAGGGAAVATDAASASHSLANVLLVTNRTGEALTFYEAAFAWLAKAPASDEQAQRMGILMQANYERCLAATGLPPEEIRERVQKVLPAKKKAAPAPKK